MQFQNHWWWRPGWRHGRHFYACHVDFSGYDEFHRLAAAYQGRLAAFEALDLIPRRWSHLTVQGIGFVDEIAPAELDRLAERLGAVLSTVPRPTVGFHRPTIRSEAIFLPAVPPEPLQAVWQAIGTTIADVLGVDRHYTLREQASGFHPHVSLAYGNRAAPTAPVAAALAELETDPVTVAIPSISLMKFHRDDRMYQWTELRSLPIG